MKVRDFERRLVEPLKRAYDGAHSLPALLHVLELYEGISRREYIRVSWEGRGRGSWRGGAIGGGRVVGRGGVVGGG